MLGQGRGSDCFMSIPGLWALARKLSWTVLPSTWRRARMYHIIQTETLLEVKGGTLASSRG